MRKAYILLYGALLCAMVSCRSATTGPPVEGEPSTWLQMRINGYAWYAETIEAPSLPSIVAVREANGRFTLEAYRSVAGRTDKLILTLDELGIGVWTLQPGFDNPYQTAEFMDGSTMERYYMTEFDRGVLRIRRWDPTNNIISGSFEFSATSNRMHVLNFTSGEFDNVRYIQR
jgi:hypothetical protein